MGNVLDMQLFSSGAASQGPQQDQQQVQVAHAQSPAHSNLTNGAGTIVLAVGGLFAFIYALQLVERKLG